MRRLGPEGRGRGPGGGETRPVGAEDGPLARVRPVAGPGAPGRSWVEWVDPSGEPVPERGDGVGGATGEAVQGEAGGIERAPIPEDYREHVRTYFGEGR